MKVVMPDEVHSVSVAALGLDAASLDLTSVEALSALCRRSASLLCPCTEHQLITSVCRALSGLADEATMKTEVEVTLSALIAYGDLYTCEQPSESNEEVLLYLSPPSFVRRENGSVIILGITPDQTSPLPANLTEQISYANHVRRLGAEVRPELPQFLLSIGFIEIPARNWFDVPAYNSPLELFAFLDPLLDRELQYGDLENLTIVDSAKSPTYYRARWVIPSDHSGKFVGRRGRKYGSPIWCYVDIEKGRVRHVLDLPVKGSGWRGCDWGWYVQSALDHAHGSPQRYRVIDDNRETVLVQFFSPLPRFVQRRWDIVGEGVPASGCLCAYRIHRTELGEELNFVRSNLWLVEFSS